eukprot:TRINITY_DN18438_c0_g1_i1.p1 TRINITY_DN18438_c0_g1~~TRINITY_DN18438_c0_g1_i1.p1  ORF type:complete len:167 (-),score=45.04 TRINITY_DN18438_c0_g1_i1:37-537(-)
MSTVVVEQNERAFQKQAGVSLNRNRILLKKFGRKPKGTLRYFSNVGLGFKTPKEAIEGTFVDKKCPFTGDVSIRGRILRGICVSTKMKRTLVLRRDYLHFIRKYNRFEKRHTNISCHVSPAFRDVKEGDILTVGQCRPLSKTVRFNVLKVEKQEVTSNPKKLFRLF